MSAYAHEIKHKMELRMPDALTEVRDSTAWFVLNRPDDMNALNEEIIETLDSFLEETGADESLRCLVISGNGRAFCAGADLKATTRTDPLPPGVPDFVDRVCAVFGKLRNFNKPVIASLNGYTMAGGLELAMCCDLVVAAESAKIGDAHANFGVFPGAGGAAILPRIVPANVAKYLLFTGKLVSAAEMKSYGFVNEVVDDRELRNVTQSLADEIAAKSPVSLSRMKAVAKDTLGGTAEAALQHEQVLFRQHMRSADAAEGLSAFAEKRTPEFTGR